MTTYQYPRTQYLFDLVGVRCKSRGDTLILQNNWNIFERVENFDDVIYNRFTQGIRDKTYYQFSDRAELNAYRLGQQQHINRYSSTLPASTFDSIRERPMPNVPVVVPTPTYSQISRCCIPTIDPIPQSEYREQQSDLTIYMHVSSYNQTHVYKYMFTSDEEKMAYHRSERLVRLSVV